MLHVLSRALRPWIPLVALVFVAGCTDDDDDANIEGPDFPTGPGRIYNVESVQFNTVDGVSVSASFGKIPGSGSHAVVILVHEVGVPEAHQEWLSSGVFEALLEGGYNVHVTPSPQLEFLFKETAAAIHDHPNGVVVSRFEALPAIKNVFGRDAQMFLIDSAAPAIDRPISNFILDSFADHFGLTHLNRSASAADFLDWFTPTPSLPSISGKSIRAGRARPNSSFAKIGCPTICRVLRSDSDSHCMERRSISHGLCCTG